MDLPCDSDDQRQQAGANHCFVENARSAGLLLRATVDRITLRFIPAVLAVTILTMVACGLVGPEPELSHIFVVGLSVLIIAYPIAMGLATLTLIMIGTGHAAKLSVFFLKSTTLQHLHSGRLW